MTKKKSKIVKIEDKHNLAFAKGVYQFIYNHISSKEAESFIVERLAKCYDAFPQQRIEDHKAYFQWLGIHNEG